jgi:hypothetical protein
LIEENAVKQEECIFRSSGFRLIEENAVKQEECIFRSSGFRLIEENAVKQGNRASDLIQSDRKML